MLKNQNKPTALITGASGFIGSHLTNYLLLEGWNIHLIIRKDTKIPVIFDFKRATFHIYNGKTSCLINCLRKAQPDIVFHIASHVLPEHSNQDIDKLINSNILFGTQILEAMNTCKVKSIINTGTSWQHYNNADYDPVCLYAATKQAFESILKYYTICTDVKAITLKLFDTYGTKDFRPKLFNLLNEASMHGTQLNMSEGNQYIDLVHINDVIDAYIKASHRLFNNNIKEHECYAISSGQHIKLRDLVKLYVDITKKEININWGGRPYRPKEVMSPWNLGKQLDNWRPRITLEEGIRSLQNYKVVPQ